MNKKQSLKILIQYSRLLKDEVKQKLYSELENMSEQNIDNLGQLLSYEMKAIIETHPDLLLSS